MKSALKIEISCDRTPAQQNVIAAVVAVIGHRPGAWKITVHELHGGNCWDIRIQHPDGVTQHFVFTGDQRSADNVRKTIEREFRHHDFERIM
jgi:hypothetical protein